MAQKFHHHIIGDFHIKNGRNYRIIKVFRPIPNNCKNAEKRTILTPNFLGKNLSAFQSYLPTKWEAGVSYEIQRAAFKAGTHTPIEN